VVIVTPAPRGSRAGNRTTALRWAGLLRRLGAQVRIRTSWQGEPCDVLVAVHAAKSAASVLACATEQPTARIVVLLAGTDVYPDFEPTPATLQALQSADALVALQPLAHRVLPMALRPKVRTILQSASALPAHRAALPQGPFRACVLAHLRPVKDPLLPFLAMARLSQELRIELRLAGRALDEELATATRAATERDPRCRWLGELSRRGARELLASSHVCIVPSAAEGGANVVSEAIAAGTPLLATRVPGNTGLLGEDWPGLFAAGDANGLAALLHRAATEPAFYRELSRQTLALQPLVAPDREAAAWAKLLMDLQHPSAPGS